MNTKSKVSKYWKLIVAILICEIVGLTSGLLSSADISGWYATLNKPSWNPPSYLFGPVWTSLYFLMGISLWLIWKKEKPEKNYNNQYILFAAQLFLNFWWSLIFFKFHSPGLALIEIVLLLILILLTIISFSRISKPAAWLLVPYIAWVSFATMLNYEIYILNK